MSFLPAIFPLSSMRLAINRPSILLCPYYLKEGEKKVTDRENVRGGRGQHWCDGQQKPFSVGAGLYSLPCAFIYMKPWNSDSTLRHHSYLTDEDTEPARGRAEPEPVLWLEAFCAAGSHPIQQTCTLLSDTPRAIDTLTNGVCGPS